MKMLRIGFLGTRTTNFQQMAEFLQGVLGLEAVWAKPDWSGFRLPTGQNDFVEVFGPDKQDANLMPDSVVGPLVAFIVEDLTGAHTEVTAAGLDWVSEIVWAGEGFGWFFFRAPDGNIYCIEQVPE